MSFIAKNPMTIPEIETAPPIPLTGTRGLFAKSDGWYDIDNEGNMNGLQYKTDDALNTTDKTVVGAINEIDTNKELEIERIKYYGDPDIIPSDESYFTVNETGETITGLTDTGKTQTELVIPYKINDVEITALNSGDSITSILEGNSIITKVVIPNSITSTGDYAFYGCTSLTSITIPNSVTSIGVSTFRECTSLTSINIPNIVTTIGDRAFYNCTSLTSVEIPNSVTSIRSGAFYGCTSLTSIIIPNSITSIGVSVFKNCSSLTSINIPSSVTNIGNDVFTGCTNLTIYCEQGSYAETFANNKGFNIVYTDISKTAINNKVDKETGKGLSANDFTDDYKTKLEGIAESAEVNVQSDWNETDSAKDAYIHNKPSIYTMAESDNRYLPMDTITGTVLQTEYAIAANAINYQVYGNSVQDGTPAPDAPIAVQSVGDLVTSGEYAGKYDVPVTVCGKNLFDISNIPLGQCDCDKNGNYPLNPVTIYIERLSDNIIKNNVGLYANSAFLYNSKITLSAGTYTISSDCCYSKDSGSKSLTIGVRDITNGISLGATKQISQYNSYERVSHTFTLNTTADIILHIQSAGEASNYKNENLLIRNIQLEKGSNATTYEPYIGETKHFYLDEPLRKIGNYADYIDYEQQKVIRNIVKIHLTGPFERYGTSTTFQFQTKYFLLKTRGEICTHFQNSDGAPTTVVGVSNKNLTGYYVTTNRVESVMGLTLSEFNTWLTENEVYYYAVLATPTEEPIILAPMPLGAGTNSITTGTAIQPSNVIVDYYQNPTDVINSLKTAIVAMQSQTE